MEENPGDDGLIVIGVKDWHSLLAMPALHVPLQLIK